MAINKWVYSLVDGRFLRGGFTEPDFDPAVEGVAEFLEEDVIDTRLHRFDETTGKRDATPEEITAADTIRTDEDAISAVEGRAIRACLIASLWNQLGRVPTPVEIGTARTRFIAAFKQLGA